MISTAQIDLFSDGLDDYRVAFAGAMAVVSERGTDAQQEFIDAWLVGSHGLLGEYHHHLCRHGHPLLRQGYRYGVRDYDLFHFGGIDPGALEIAEKRVMAALLAAEKRRITPRQESA